VQKKIVIDTNIYIEIFNSAQYESLQNPFQYIVFLAYPVLHELWMGARGKQEIKHLAAFQDRFVRLKRLIVPFENSLILIGHACHQLRRSGKLDPVYPKHYNDITIAVLARQVGATVITNNISDFKAIKKTVDFQFEKP
jgi:predicted nucleic acid-binding protein